MKGKRKDGRRRFVATVQETFQGSFVVYAKDEAEARQIVNDGIPDDYSPAQTGGGYQRHIRIDADE